MPAICGSLPCVLAPTSRLLELLELLQTQPLTTGREIADRLAIDRRTVRRYIATLQELSGNHDTEMTALLKQKHDLTRKLDALTH